MPDATRMTETVPASMLAVAQPELYRRNAFRISGLPVDAGLQHAMRMTGKLRMAQKYGGTAGARGPLALEPPPDADQLRDAIQRLKDPESRLMDEFFWFWPDGALKSQNDPALVALSRGDEPKASGQWAPEEHRNSIARHNLAVLWHAKLLDLELGVTDKPSTEGRGKQWRSVFERWLSLLDDTSFWKQVETRVANLADPRLTPETARQLRRALPMMLLTINARLALRAAQAGQEEEARRHVAVMEASGLEKSLIQRTVGSALDPIRQRIKLLCTNAEKDRGAAPERAHEVCRQLLDQAHSVLRPLDALLPKGDPVKTGAHDELALMALSCQIAYGNKTEDWSTSLQLLEETLKLAVGASARKRVEHNIGIVRGNIEIDTCHFCGTRLKDDASALPIKMHGDVKEFRTSPTSTRTTWIHSTLQIPRCVPCRKVHRGADLARGTGWFLGVLVVLSMFILLQWLYPILDESTGLGLYLAAILLAGGLPVYVGFAVSWARLGGILHVDKMYEHSSVKRRQEEGWTFGEEPPGIQPTIRDPNAGRLLGSLIQPIMKLHVPGIILVPLLSILLVIPVLLAPLVPSWKEGGPEMTLLLHRFELLDTDSVLSRLLQARMEPDLDVDLDNRILTVLTKVAPADAVTSLTESMGSEDAEIRARAAAHLGSLGELAAPAVPSLQAALTDITPSVRNAAISALKNIDADTIVPSLLDALKSKDQSVRKGAIASLGTLGAGGVKAVPALRRISRSRRDPARGAAIHAIEQITGK